MPPLPAPQPLPEPPHGDPSGDGTTSTTSALHSQPLPPPTAEAEAYAQIKALFDAVCELDDSHAVLARLQALAATQPQCDEVLALWQTDAAGRTRLGAPVAGMLASASQSGAPELAAGATLGAWRLVAPLGAGGMGQVFLAERDDGLYEQRVAIKLLRGWQGPAAQALLARERRILASLQHPHIAALVDGGTTPAGRPYLVIAFVDGQPLDVWCRQTKASFDTRLRQLQTVAEAIAYAHRRLVVHCDIKPANVQVDVDGRAMLLDFGIAQLQDRGADDAPRALTPHYASPEQQAGEPAQVESDVYALGRVLEELLSAPEAGTEAARRRAEWQAIVARACARAPADRYASVDALLADLRRLRTHRPLQALQDAGWPYRLRKLLRRQWPWALAGSAALGLATAGVLQLMHQRDRALQAQAQARAEATTARQVGDLLIKLFEGADPARGGRPDTPASTLVDRGLDRVQADLIAQPEQQAVMLSVLARVYDNMGRLGQAADAYRDAAAIEEQLGRPLRAAALLRAHAFAVSNNGQTAAAVAPARRALALFDAAMASRGAAATAGAASATRAMAAEAALRTSDGPESGAGLAAPTRAGLLTTLGTVLATSGGLAEAEPLLQQALQLTAQADPGDRDARLQQAQSLHAMGILRDRRAQYAESVRDFEEALQIKKSLLGDTDLSTLTTAQRLVPVLARLGRIDDAERMAREVVQRRKVLTGDTSEPVARALNELGNVLQDGGRLGDAITAYAQAAAITRAAVGPSSIVLAQQLNNLASAFEEQGSPAAGPLYRESLAIRSALLPPGDQGLARAGHNLGRWLLRQGDAAAARPLLQAALQSRQAKLPAGHDDIANSQLLLAETELLLRRPEEAQAIANALLLLEPTLPPMRQAALWRLQALLLQARGDRAGALVPTERALARVMERLPRMPGLLQPRLEAAELQLALGRRDAADATLRALLPLALAQHPSSPWRLRAVQLQARLAAAAPITRTNPKS